MSNEVTFFHTVWAYVDVKKVRGKEQYQAELRIHSTDSKARKTRILNSHDLHQLRKDVYKAFYDLSIQEGQRVGHPLSNTEDKTKIYRTVTFPTYLQARVLPLQVKEFPNILEVQKLCIDNGIDAVIGQYQSHQNAITQGFEKTKVLLIDGIMCQFATVVRQVLLNLGKTELANSFSTDRGV